MNYDRLYALRNKFKQAALELDLVSGRIDPDTGLENPNYEPDYLQDLMEYNVLEILDLIHEQGHSGFSHGYLLSLLIPLLEGKPITPLTGKDWEWGTSCGGVTQNNRCCQVFKREDGSAFNAKGMAFSSDGGRSWWTNADSHTDISFPCSRKDLETKRVYVKEE